MNDAVRILIVEVRQLQTLAHARPCRDHRERFEGSAAVLAMILADIFDGLDDGAKRLLADRDALRVQVADLERRLADLTRLVATAEVEDET